MKLISGHKAIHALDQANVIEFLSSPAVFEDGTKRVDVISTHGAKVFLGCHHVLKIKRAINYGYMDFSTLEKRYAACKKEIELNKPIAPSIYLDVLPITAEESGELAVDGKGEIVEWCVQMHRFDERSILQRAAEEGRFSKEISAQIGKQIAYYHLELQPLEVSDGAKRVQSVIDILDEYLVSSKKNPHSNSFHEFSLKAKFSLEKFSGDLNVRARNGLVRRCHGDLHLRNIVMIDDIPTPFDALEFSEELASIDVLYDLAFLIMDLLHLGLRAQANFVLNRYANFAWELFAHGGFSLMPLFLSLRSAIRFMVSMQRVDCDLTSSKEARTNALKYMDEAVAFLKPQKNVLLAVGGFSGTGKSTLASSLAPQIGMHFGALHLRSDVERKKMFGVEEFSCLPEEAYEETVSNKVYERLFEKAEFALKQGQSVIVDAVFTRNREQQHCIELAKKLQVTFCGLWLSAPKETLVERVSKRTDDASDADAAVIEKQITQYPDIKRNLTKGWEPVDASGDLNASLQNAQKIVGKKIELVDVHQNASSYFE